jgi:hypothetical protein
MSQMTHKAPDVMPLKRFIVLSDGGDATVVKPGEMHSQLT